MSEDSSIREHVNNQTYLKEEIKKNSTYDGSISYIDEEQSFFDVFFDSVLIIRDRKILLANNKAIDLFGYSITEMVGKDLNLILNPYEEYVDEIDKIIRTIYQGKSVLPIELKLKIKDGTIKYINITGKKYLFRNISSMLIIVKDITEQKKAEENKRLLDDAIRFDKLRTEFFSNLSHELKTPLNIIFGSIQLVDSLHDASEVCKNYKRMNRYINCMRQNCYRLLRLINNLIDISKIDSGFLNINLTNHNIISVIEDITLSVLEYTQIKGINLIFDTDVEEKIIAIDIDKIERVVLNLLSNAIKFTEEGGSIYVNMYDKNDKICITVRDTGIGIPENMLDKVFDRFRQVDSSLNINQGGSGIGLSIVKSIVKAHEGNISVKSQYGLGSEFIIELPVKLVEENKNIVHNSFLEQKNVERINIEFSDIYSQ